MEEDVAGTLREIHKVGLVTCDRCGREVPWRDTRLVPGNLLEEAATDEARVCPQCWEELERGPANPPT